MVLAHLVHARRRSTRPGEVADESQTAGGALADDGHQADERAVVPVVEIVRPLVPEGRQQERAGDRQKVVAAPQSLFSAARRRHVRVRRPTRPRSRSPSYAVTRLPLLVGTADVVERRL